MSSDCAGTKTFHWEFSDAKYCPITEDPKSIAHLVRHFKSVGCPLMYLQNMMQHDAYMKMVVSHAKVPFPDLVSGISLIGIVEANNKFSTTLEQRLKDVPCAEELNKVKQVVRELKLSLKLAQYWQHSNSTQLTAAEKLKNLVASIEARLRVIGNYRKAALKRDYFLEAKIKASSSKYVEDLRSASYEVFADSYFDV